MKRPLARALTSLHAPSWQQEYGCEFEALLAEIPCTPSLLVDVVPRALFTRKRSAAIILASLILLGLARSQLALTDQSSQIAGSHVDRRARALAACLSYSSLSRSGIIARQQCLD